MAIAPNALGSDEVSTVLCQIRLPGLKLDRATLEDAETCLTPVLSEAETLDTITSIEQRAKSLTVPSIVTEKFDRFSVGIYVSLDSFALKVLGPGRTADGSQAR
jgi:hypothetical protein